jgi:Zn-dependent peptidase ImmA (M78 family)
MVAYEKFIEASSRIHFDLAHELGHFFLHDESFAETVKEPQAHEFASSFLMPEEEYAPDSPLKWHLGMFIEIKHKWHVSLQAALRRSRDLGLITESSYRWGMVDISKKGFRQKEPAEFSLGKPSLLAKAIDLVKDSLIFDDFAEAVHALPEELESILIHQKVDKSAILAMQRQRPEKKSKILSFTPR